MQCVLISAPSFPPSFSPFHYKFWSRVIVPTRKWPRIMSFYYYFSIYKHNNFAIDPQTINIVWSPVSRGASTREDSVPRVRPKQHVQLLSGFNFGLNQSIITSSHLNVCPQVGSPFSIFLFPMFVHSAHCLVHRRPNSLSSTITPPQTKRNTFPCYRYCFELD